MSFKPSNYLYQPDQGQQDDYFNQSLGSMNQNAGQLPYMRYGGFGSGSDSGLPDPTFYQQQAQPQDQMQGQGQGGFADFQQMLNANQDMAGTMPVNQPDIYGATGMGVDPSQIPLDQMQPQDQGDFNSALAGIGQSTGLNTLPTLTRSDNPNPSVDNPAAAPGVGSTPNQNQGIQPPPPPPASGSPYPGANGTNSNYQFQRGVDYSQPGAINYTDFQGNAYAKANANRLPTELDPNTSLQGGIDPNKYATLKSQYGYQMAQNGIADYNQAEQMLYAAGRQDPNSDYYLVDVAGGGYAILKRARTAQGQIDAGFTPPSMRPATNQSTGSSGGRGYGSQFTSQQQKQQVQPPTPPVKLNPTLLGNVGASMLTQGVNSVDSQAIEQQYGTNHPTGYKVSYGGQTWVYDSANKRYVPMANPYKKGGGGGALPPAPQLR